MNALKKLALVGGSIMVLNIVTACSSLPQPNYVSVSTDPALLWQVCSVGQRNRDGECVGDAEALSWSEALAYAERMTASTGMHWRLPTVEELSALVFCAYGKHYRETVGFECTGDQPAATIDLQVFPNTATGKYWTSTQPDSSKIAWYVDFSNGRSAGYYVAGEAAMSNYLRLVTTAP